MPKSHDIWLLEGSDAEYDTPDWPCALCMVAFCDHEDKVEGHKYVPYDDHDPANGPSY